MAKMLPSKKANVTESKAKKILSDGTVRGTPLSKKQKGLFGAIAGGAPTAAPKPPGNPGPPMGAGPASPLAALGAMAAPRPPRPPMAGSSAGVAPKKAPPRMAIGQRPTLGARTKAAMKRR